MMYLNRSSQFIYDSIDNKFIRTDDDGLEYVITNDRLARLSSFRHKTKPNWFIHYMNNNRSDEYRTEYQVARQLKITRSLIFKLYRQKLIYNGIAINKNKQIQWDEYSEYIPPIVEIKQNKPNLMQLFMQQQDFHAKVQRGIPFFDSCIGVDTRIKNIYRLTEQQAKEQHLEQVFPESRLYINPTKQIYVKQGDYYYQLLMD